MVDRFEMQADDNENSWQEKAKEFAQARLRLYGARTLVDLLFPLLFWYAGWSLVLARFAESLSGMRWLEVVLFLAIYEVISAVIFLPFAYYAGFVLQHRFGLSRESRSGWMADWLKSSAIGALFFTLGLTAFYLLVPSFPGAWWWILGIAFSLVAVLLTYVAPVLLLPIFYKRSPVQDARLVERIKGVAEKAGARVSQIYTIDMSRRTVAANAALTGIGRTRQVLLGDTMLQSFSLDEVETVIAHELGHHVHGDIWKGLAAEVGGLWAGLLALQYLVRPAFLQNGLGDIAELANLPLLLFLGGVASLIFMPVANAISRHYESEADAFAARISRMPEAYAGALYRLAKQNLSELWPARWVEILFYTHPAIGRRMQSVSRGRAETR